MDTFSVNKLAKIAGVSVRTLHHYDKIGLLKPLTRTESRYRYYGTAELFRLQQILLYKELDFPLARIAGILDEPGFDMMSALQEHKAELQKRKDRMATLLITIDNTIHQLKNKSKKMDHNEMYKGFSKEQAAAYKKEASERWGAETIKESEEKILAMNKGQWDLLKQEGDDIYNALIPLMAGLPSDGKVQQLIKRHYEMTGKYFNVTPEIYRNLGSMYVDDLRFTAFYNKYKTGLAAFIRDAIHVFCDGH